MRHVNVSKSRGVTATHEYELYCASSDRLVGISDANSDEYVR